MSKQVFTTGQVLTSAEMTQLQTNDYNQTVSAKVASYVLVAADAGTRITMSNASATTVTVNTALFAAGDTLIITNIGVGVCTITAGTATVSTGGSLALSQYDSGTLYFTSTGVAIWNGANPGDITGITTGGTSGLTGGVTSGTADLKLAVTTNGDLLYGTGSGTVARLGIGSSAQVLSVSSGIPAWTTASAGGGMTLLSTTSLSGSTTTISSIDQTYTKLEIMIVGWTPNTGNADLRCRFNSDSSTHYISGTSGGISSAFSGTYGGVDYGQSSSTTGAANFNWMQIPYYTNTSMWKIAQNLSSESLNATPTSVNAGISLFSWNQTSAINALTFFPSTGTFTGTVYIYGVK